MIIRILLLFLSLIVLVNLCIITCCFLTGQNLYKKYGKQMLVIFGSFVLIVAAMYVTVALIGLR